MSDPQILTTFSSPLWKKNFPTIEETLSKAIEVVLEHFPLYRNKIELGVTFADDAFIQELNREYRQKDKPTNVLSFPLEDLQKGTYLPKVPQVMLGDMIFAFETIQREAAEKKISFQDHFCHLCIHSFLHLLGYTHDTDEDGEEMESLEVQLLSKLGIADPYGR